MQRVLRINSTLQDIGTVLDDATSEIQWNGVRLREIFLENCDWDSVTWISPDGIAYQRYYNVWNETWRFSDAKAPGVGENGELFMNVGSGSGAQRIRLCRAIALAWIEHPKVNPQEKRVAMQLRDDDDLHCDNIGWVRRNFRAPGDDEYPQVISLPLVAPHEDENWYQATVYRYWKNGQYEKFDCPERVTASGWMARVDGSFTRGVRSYNGRLRACLSSCGSIWMEDLLYGTIRGTLPLDKKTKALCYENVSENRLSVVDRDVVLNEVSQQMYSQFCDGDSIEHLSVIHDVPKAVVWTRLCNLVEFLPDCEIPVLFWDNVIYNNKIREVFGEWVHAQNPILGFPLKKIKEGITEKVGWVSLDDDDFFGMLKLAREFAKRRRFVNNSCTVSD